MNKKTLIWVGVGVVAIGAIIYVRRQNELRKSKVTNTPPPSTATVDNDDNVSNADGVVAVSGGSNRFKCTSTGEVFNGGTYDQFAQFESRCKANGGKIVKLSALTSSTESKS